MNTDWIEESKNLAANIKAEGFPEESQKIIEAIISGSTGSEILMGLKWNLKEILQTTKNIKPERKAKIKEIIRGIKAIL